MPPSWRCREGHFIRDVRHLRNAHRLGGRRPTAFQKEADRDGFTIAGGVIRSSQDPARDHGGSYELYAEVLRRTAVESPSDWDGSSSRRGRVPARLASRAGAFPRDQRALERFAKKYRSAWSRTSTTSCSGQTRATSARTSTSSSPRSRCAPTSRTLRTSRRPSAASAARRAGSTSRSSCSTTSSRCVKAQDPRDLGQPHEREARAGRRSRPRKSRTSATRPSCSACETSVRVLALHQDVIVGDLAHLPDDLHARAARGTRRFVVDSPIMPGRAGAGWRRSRRPVRVPRRGPAGHPPRLGPPAGTVRVRPTRHSAWRSPPRTSCAATRGRRPARAARLRRRALRDPAGAARAGGDGGGAGATPQQPSGGGNTVAPADKTAPKVTRRRQVAEGLQEGRRQLHRRVPGHRDDLPDHPEAQERRQDRREQDGDGQGRQDQDGDAAAEQGDAPAAQAPQPEGVHGGHARPTPRATRGPGPSRSRCASP